MTHDARRMTHDERDGQRRIRHAPGWLALAGKPPHHLRDIFTSARQNEADIMNRTNLILDTGLLLAFLVAMEPRFSGVPIHEWGTLALALAVIVHLLLHWDWIINVGATFFRKLWHSSRLKFVVDVLLFVAFITVMLSGVEISRVAAPAVGLPLASGGIWRLLHTLSADLGILLVGVHFALSWKWVVSTVDKYLVRPIGRLFKPRGAVAPVAARAPGRKPGQ